MVILFGQKPLIANPSFFVTITNVFELVINLKSLKIARRSLFCGPSLSRLMGVTDPDFALEDTGPGIVRCIILTE